MDLNDKAAESPDVTLAGDLVESEYELVETELTPADELTEPGEFPQYGDFLKVVEWSPYDGTERGETYVEVTQRLAQWLVENVDEGDHWQVDRTWKENGERLYEVTAVAGDEAGDSET
jgi:hypothetical protein